MENRGYKGWGIKKLDNRPVKVLMSDCEDPKLTAKIYNMYIGGYSEEAAAQYFGVPVEIIERAIQHTRFCLGGRTIIAHNNDRLRILVQRTESEQYRKMLGQALRTDVNEFLNAGINPSGILREYREAVGQTQKPEPLIQVNTQQNYLGGTPGNGSGIRSAEDAIRWVLKQMKEKENLREAAITVKAEPQAEAKQLAEEPDAAIDAEIPGAEPSE